VAVVLNSGGANACTGQVGRDTTAVTACHAAAVLGAVGPEQVLVCSTGLIGVPLPLDKVLGGVDAAIADLSSDGGAAAATAIMTTDTRPKNTARVCAGGYAIGGMAKGAGMLAPALATMLVVLTTDAIVSESDLAAALDRAADRTFNRIDSDGCQSTNDSVIVLASGESGVRPDLADFAANLEAACADLARQLIGDAEGSEHDIAVTVCGATSEAAAIEVARAICRSNLVKTAIYGRDPNWGRILSAAGIVPESVAPFDPGLVDLTINGVRLASAGASDASRNGVDLTPRDVAITLELHAGSAAATVLTSDLTHAYVEENSAYST
jgi:glutamate N-acetyltransferase/amino-acid N-acetyltransferase